MFKTIVTIMRGRAAEAEEQLADGHALLILDQQMRDTRHGLGRAQRALALALAEDGQEQRRLTGLQERHSVLEQRARAALAGDREDLAADAAEIIAMLEADIAASETARRSFQGGIAQMRVAVSNAEFRIAELQRGRRLARVAESVRVLRRGRVEAAGPEQSTLSEAEATLARLREQQVRVAAAEDALDGIQTASRPEQMEERLAAAGFGPALRPSVADVLARLKAAPAGAEPAQKQV